MNKTIKEGRKFMAEKITIVEKNNNGIDKLTFTQIDPNTGKRTKRAITVKISGQADRRRS